MGKLRMRAMPQKGAKAAIKWEYHTRLPQFE